MACKNHIEDFKVKFDDMLLYIFVQNTKSFRKVSLTRRKLIANVLSNVSYHLNYLRGL